MRHDAIVDPSERYAASCFWESGGPGGCPHTRVALGTSNSYPGNGRPGGYCRNDDSGRAWGDAVSRVESRLEGKGYVGRVTARATADIETGEEPYAQAELYVIPSLIPNLMDTVVSLVRDSRS